MKTEKFYTDFILDSIRKVENFTHEVTSETFLKNEEKQSAVILQLMLIGEISKRLSEETKNQMTLPWKQIIGFRDIAIHDYIDLNLDDVWNTVQSDIPELKTKLLQYLQQ